MGMLECPFHGTSNARPVTKLSPWQRRIQRADELSRQHSFAAEILGFYIHVARFQERLHRHLITVLQSYAPSMDRELSHAELAELSSQFESFLSMVEKHGPASLAEQTRDLRKRGQSAISELLADAWRVSSPSDAQGFLAHAFLQPYAEFLRSRRGARTLKQIYAVCSFCHRKPSFGVLRQMGDGAARSLVCSLCLNEWEFRRVVCPGCGEENDKKLPVFTADEFDYIRVECCDTCKTYIKSIDLTRNGNAEPIVDELSSAPLDLWAREHGYAKVQNNMFGM